MGDSSMSYRPFESTKRPRGTSEGVIYFIGLEERAWKGPEYTAWSVYNSIIRNIDRQVMAILNFEINCKIDVPMKETKQTIKFLASEVSTNDPTYPYRGPITSVTGECLSGGRSTISGLSDEMRKEMILALQQRLDVEITITVKRPETKLEEVQRIESMFGSGTALVRAKELLAGVK
jgi:hypothetical protein